MSRRTATACMNAIEDAGTTTEGAASSGHFTAPRGHVSSPETSSRGLTRTCFMPPLVNRRLKDHAVAQTLQLFDIAARGVFPFALIEIRGPEFVVRAPVLEHVIDNHEDGVGRRSRLPSYVRVTHDAPIAGGEPTVFGENRRDGRFDQRGSAATGCLSRACRSCVSPRSHDGRGRGRSNSPDADPTERGARPSRCLPRCLQSSAGSPPGSHPEAPASPRKGEAARRWAHSAVRWLPPNNRGEPASG